MKLKACYFTHTGYVRSKNEDALLVAGKLVQEDFMDDVHCVDLEGDYFLFAVADGLGGHRGGELASRMVLQKLMVLKPENQKYLLKALKEAREDLENFARENIAYLGLGTAIAGIILKDVKALVFNVGDCRVYGIEKDKAFRLTQDHTEAEDLIKAGLLTPERAKHDPRRNFLTSAIIGSPDFKNFEVFMKEVYNYRQYILCSDGVWEPLEEDELSLTPEALAKLSLEKGGSDNMSFITIKLEV